MPRGKTQTTENEPVNTGRREAQCRVCQHPQREDIEREWIDWGIQRAALAMCEARKLAPNIVNVVQHGLLATLTDREGQLREVWRVSHQANSN